jgi:hypothetical protein
LEFSDQDGQNLWITLAFGEVLFKIVDTPIEQWSSHVIDRVVTACVSRAYHTSFQRHGSIEAIEPRRPAHLSVPQTGTFRGKGVAFCCRSIALTPVASWARRMLSRSRSRSAAWTN